MLKLLFPIQLYCVIHNKSPCVTQYCLSILALIVKEEETREQRFTLFIYFDFNKKLSQPFVIFNWQEKSLDVKK